jgi:putative salt-induced outer membrane protein
VKLVLQESHASQSAALAREKQVTRWSHVKKDAVIAADLDTLHSGARREHLRPQNAGHTETVLRSFLLTLLLTVSPLLASAQSFEDELRAAEQQLAAALVAKDAAAFERLLTPGFLLRGAPDVAREVWIKNALSMCWGDRFDISDFSASGQTDQIAVVSLLLTTAQDPVTCEPAVIRSLITDVWVREGTEWRLALRHAAPPAQSVAEQFAKVDPPPPLWEGSAELSVVATGGNTDTQTLGAGASVTWRPGPWTTRGRTAFVRSATDDAVTAESLVIELRPARALSSRAEVYGRGGYLVDRFSGIDHRTTVDAGFGWLLIDDPPHTLNVDGGAGVTHEARLAGGDKTFTVASAGAAYTWRIAPAATLKAQPLVSVAFGDAGNWRLQNSLNLTVTMTRRLSVRLAHELKRINRPVPGFRRMDTVLSAALVARF